MNLDKFLQKNPTETFVVKGKEYVADLSALSFMKIMEMDGKDLSETEQTIKALEIIFGKEKADELWKLLNAAGLQAIITRVTEIMQTEVDNSTKK